MAIRDDEEGRPRRKLAKDGTYRGRPEGSMSKLSREAIAHARVTGDGRLPHEILLSIARGQPIQLVVVGDDGKPIVIDDEGTLKTKWVIPDLEDIRDAAKAGAPYYAPKISTVEVIQGISDNELDQIIARAAAEAGVSVGFGGAKPPPEDQEDSSSADGRGAIRRRRSAE